MKFKAKLLNHGYSKWVLIKKDIIKELGYETGDFIEFDVKKKRFYG